MNHLLRSAQFCATGHRQLSPKAERAEQLAMMDQRTVCLHADRGKPMAHCPQRGGSVADTSATKMPNRSQSPKN
jgi:hypothetical protein